MFLGHHRKTYMCIISARYWSLCNGHQIWTAGAYEVGAPTDSAEFNLSFTGVKIWGTMVAQIITPAHRYL